ncbi:BTB/POZ domain-containing protein 9 [Aphelenchoides besseyi]|nr:BTB/POZ domain-containing protein 9 [Aphelenchoides besseyi]
MSDSCRLLHSNETTSGFALFADESVVPSSSRVYEHNDAEVLTKQIGMLYLSSECSDVILIVENERIPAHRVILATRSEYFRAMLFGGLREQTEKEVTLLDTPLAAFKQLLRYIYTGRIPFTNLRLDQLLEIFQLVNKYGFTDLEQALCDYLKQSFHSTNIAMIYATASFYSISDLTNACLDYIDRRAEEVLQTEAFYQLSAPAVCNVLSRNSLCAMEICVFKAVARWLEVNNSPENVRSSLLNCVRLPLIKMDDLLTVVRPTNLIASDKLLDVIGDQSMKKNDESLYRGFKMLNVNIATKNWGARCIEGINRDCLLNEENQTSDLHTSHGLINPKEGIIVELGRPFIINSIQLQLTDKLQKSYSYYVEVGINREDWIRVADYTKYVCRGQQKLFFPQRVVKFIKVFCTRSTDCDFHLLSMKAMFSNEAFDYDPETTLLRPIHNVATIEKNANVIEGVSRKRNALLDGEREDYDWDSGYTCHQLGSGSIIINLPQPYLVNSMRLLLWDLDDRVYSFNIDVSSDNERWMRVIEATGLRSWQTLRFPTIPVVFIRIEGTFNSANEVFHCVHFECPMERDLCAPSDGLPPLAEEPTTLPVIYGNAPPFVGNSDENEELEVNENDA